MTTHDVSLFNASLLHDAYERLYGSVSSRNQIIRSLSPVGHSAFITGPAYTLRFTRVPANEADGRIRIMSAFDAIPPGAVLVIQVVGDPSGGVVGDLVAHRLSEIGIKGAIVDGPVRDVSGILRYDLRVWSREVVISGMAANELRLESGCEVAIDGVAIRPGDLVSADVDGVYVVPAESIESTAKVAGKLVEEEELAHQRLSTGISILESYPTIRGAAG